MIRVGPLSDVPVGSLIWRRNRFALMLETPSTNTGEHSIASFAKDENRVFHQVVYGDQEVLHFVGEVVLKLDTRQGLGNGAPNMESGLTVFAGHQEMLVVLRLPDSDDWRFVNLLNATIPPGDVTARTAFDFWKLGVRQDGGDVAWLLEVDAPTAAA